MVNWIISKLWLKPDSFFDEEYLDCVNDIVENDLVKSMKNYMQHGDVDCLEHCMYVSYLSYSICKKYGKDYRSAARGGLLHDFFLYDWHTDKPKKGLHGIVHPKIALINANQHFVLNEKEQDIIVKHMWPVTPALPKYLESWIVIAMDKYCATIESFNFFGQRESVASMKPLLTD